MKLAATIALIAALQGRTLYEDPSRSIRVYGYTTAEGGVLENGDFEFKMTGSPAVVESRLEGLKVEGQNLQGIVAPATESTRGFLRQLQVTSQTVLTIDSAIQYQAQLEHANRFGGAQPALPTAKNVAILRTDRATYQGSAAQGTFTIPSSFTIEADSGGKQGETTFTQKLTASGRQAELKLDPASNDTLPIQEGVISGPVKIDIDRLETTPGKPDERTKMDGVADRIEIDLKTARTITLRGNVRVQGSSGIYMGTSEGDVVVIGLNEALKPISVRITGNPVKSTLRENRSGGGK